MPPDKRILFYVVAASFWGFMLGLAFWLLVACWKHRLRVDDNQMIHHGVISTKEILWLDVAEAKWRTRPVEGSIVLISNSTKLTISFGNYERDAKLPLIRFLRQALPTSIQQNWDLFCLKTALPLRKRKTVPGPDEVLLTRRRIDRLGGFMLATCIGGMLVVNWVTGRPPMMIGLPASVAFSTVFWLFLRYNIPAKGLVEKRLQWKPDGTNRGMREASLLAGGPILLFLIYCVGQKLPYVQAFACAGIIVVLGTTIALGISQERARERRDKARSAEAAAEWGALENAELAASFPAEPPPK